MKISMVYVTYKNSIDNAKSLYLKRMNSTARVMIEGCMLLHLVFYLKIMR